MQPSPNRKLAARNVFLLGALLGAICYVVSESLVPAQVGSPEDHDRSLAIRLGFIYTPMVGLWLGFLQRSWGRAWIGACVGVAIGLAYMTLCMESGFLAIMVAFPCLLGGGLAAIASSNRSPWLHELGARFAKGLVAGFVLGVVYLVTLNVVGAAVAGMGPTSTDGYVAMMYRAGPIALGLASGLFLVLLRWAVGLARIRAFFKERRKLQVGKCRTCGYPLSQSESMVCPECGLPTDQTGNAA